MYPRYVGNANASSAAAVGAIEDFAGALDAHLGSDMYASVSGIVSDAVFGAVAAAFTRAKAAGLRRTAGDALSDLGDARAVPTPTLTPTLTLTLTLTRRLATQP